MASPTLEYLRSPFENVFQILPQGHDKALKQAFYNTGATLFVVVVCSAALAVYYILEAFLGPLLWAVLCGTFLHPFKNTLTSIVRGWLQSLRESGTPLVLGTVLLPVRVLDSTSSKFGIILWTNAYLFLGACVTLPLLCFIFSLWPLGEIFGFFYASFVFVYEALGYFSAVWVWSVVAAYLVSLYWLWTPDRAVIFRLLSAPVWVALLFHLVTIAGPFRVPLLLAVIVMMTVGLLSDDSDETDGDRRARSVWPGFIGRFFKKSPPVVKETDDEDDVISDVTKKEDSQLTGDSSVVPELDADSPISSDVGESGPVEREHAVTGGERSLSSRCFIALLWGIVVVQIWSHLWLVQIVPLLLACLFIKKIGAQLGSWSFLQQKAQCVANHITGTFCGDSRVKVLAPRPVKVLAKLMLKGDRKIVSVLENSMDKFMSILIIILLIVGVILMSFFVVVQVQKESVHLVTVTSNVLNRSDISQYLPAHEDMQKAVDSMVGNTYLYGREWIVNKLHGMLSGDEESKERVQRQVLQVWDQVYQKWFAKNASAPERPPMSRQMSLVDLSDVDSVWQVVDKAKSFNLDLASIAQENIGTLMSILESVWSVLKGNVTLAFSLLSATVSMVFGGGTALLNFILSVVIFLTALFYLLSSSGEQYLPVQWFINLSPTQGGTGNQFGRAVEEAISSVLLASLKMALFYGLYTWWTHTLFGLQIIFIPSALAAISAAVPFLGTYIAAVPGIIELWFVSGRRVEAVLLIILHLLPISVVDTAIYSEIKGGHPYMTGLAIAGGIYWLGLQGAVIGPILLCCLVVAVNMYTSMIKPDPAPDCPMYCSTNQQESQVPNAQRLQHAGGITA